MIFFCEDCGTRNVLTDEYIKQGIVTFRCQACNYLNSYPMLGTTRQPAVHISKEKNSNQQRDIKKDTK